MEFADKFFEISTFLSKHIINHIYTPVLFLLILQLSLKEKTDISTPIKLIKWIIISYCFVTILSWLFVAVFPSSPNYAFINRATGPYYWAYWMMLFFNCFFPLVLFIKRYGNNVYILFLISLLMNIGWIFERFIIIITSIHRDYLP